mmetsp:Transcript_124132/g.241881  ORF Transcript_124132/g.241881 Transcript_124132/m.241881 type:complete len:96 (+) Transcript_124132:1167-1454(+)
MLKDTACSTVVVTVLFAISSTLFATVILSMFDLLIPTLDLDTSPTGSVVLSTLGVEFGSAVRFTGARVTISTLASLDPGTAAIPSDMTACDVSGS